MTEAIAANTEQVAPSNGRLRLDLPNPPAQPVVASDHDESSPDDLPAATGLPEEDVHSVVGVSISRAQTRLMSPQTPAAEKAAAMAGLEGGGLFDGFQDENHEAGAVGRTDEEEPTPGSEQTRPVTPPRRQPSVNLPSPWRAEPRTFEKDKAGHTVQHSGSTSVPMDFNVRRYMANFNLPSLPKTPSFRDFSVPSLSSILSNTRSISPSRRNESRQKRASTLDQPVSSFAFAIPFQTRSTFEARPKEAGHGRPDSAKPREDSHEQSLGVSGETLVERYTSTVKGHRKAASNSSTHSPQPPPLRRTTSDQSLLLRRVTSAGSSLGDDSRWENVQEQVNSRVKAIKDSLQDSSIKLPSLPNLSTLNLNSLRPDFTKSRAHSDAKRPTVAYGHAPTNIACQAAVGEAMPPLREVRDTTNAEAPQMNGKVSKATYSYLDEALKNLTGDLVVLGGYRGSILRSAQPPHRRLWVPVKVGLNIRKVNLEVGLQPEDEEDMHNHIFASGMLSHIGPVDMGKRLLKRLRTCKNAVEGRLRIHDYGYDWRLSPHLLSQRLLAFLQELPCNGPDVPARERGATIIAHSMGGLITRHVVNQQPDLFAGVVYAGVPQHCVNILGPLRNGDEVLLSSKVLTAQVNFSFRSTFLLLPEDGKCFINKETKEEYPVDFFDVEQWKQYAWSPCITPALPPANPQENKSLLGSMTDMLPSMPSLPLPGRKASTSRSNNDPNVPSSVATTPSQKITNLANTSATRALDPQFSPNPTHPSPQNTLPLPLTLPYLHRTLHSTLSFKSQLVHSPSHQSSNRYPPFSILYSTTTPTVSAARVSSRAAISHADACDDLQFASGDGVCLARAAMLPAGYRVVEGGKVRTERGHVGLLGDLEGVGRCLGAVGEGRRGGCGLGKEGGKEGRGDEGVV